MIGRRAELVGQFIKIGGQHHIAFRVPQHQHQAEDFQAEKKQQYAGIEYGRPYHRQAHRGHDLQRRCANRSRRFFHIRTDAAQRGRDIEIGVWNVRQSGDRHDAEHRIDIPGHKADQLLDPLRKEAYRSRRHHVTKGQHHRRYENRHQNQRLNNPSAG